MASDPIEKASCSLIISVATAISAESVSWPTVDLAMRSHAGEASMILMLLRSVELFWPRRKWGVLVVLDNHERRAKLHARCLSASAKFLVETASLVGLSSRSTLSGSLKGVGSWWEII